MQDLGCYLYPSRFLSMPCFLTLFFQADNQANLYGGSRTGVSTDAAVNDYISSGATPGKIVMGNTLFPSTKDPK